jgi:ParB family chromosome partitioning protein
MAMSEAPAEAASATGVAPVMRELPLPAAAEALPLGVRVLDIPLESIVPNPHQPRREFNDASLAELAASLKSTGMIQPVIVRPDGAGGDTYQLIAGERRWRAAKLAELATLPAIVRDVDGPTQAQMALIENIQREDLNPLDRARAYQTLLQHLGLTQAELAGRLGEDRSTVTHFLRILELPEPVQAFIGEGRLTLAHAKLLGGIVDPAEQQRLAELAVAQSLSVRNLERLVQGGATSAPPKAAPAPTSAHMKDLERSLSRQLSLRVQVRGSRKKGHGRLVLHYSSLDQFDDLMSRLGVRTELE